MAAALITGATGGLGRVLAFEHVRHGGDVILVDCHAAKLQALSAELRRAAPGQQVELVVVDFTAADAAQQVFAAVQAVGWPVDYLINNAGFGGGGAFVTRSAARDPAGDGAGECGGAHGVVEIIFTGDGGARTRSNFKRGVRRGVVPRTGTSDLFYD